MAARIWKHPELDRRLDALASDLDNWDKRVERLVDEMDAGHVALEISDPRSWRTPGESSPTQARVPLRQQFRADVDTIQLLDREPEAKLARRIELARRRLDRELERNGLSKDELIEGIGTGSFGFASSRASECTLPGMVCRRWLELHALRTELVERNLYLVLINVERYSHTTANLNDLIQEGCQALFRAVDGFDWKRGLLFRTYAVHWLFQAFRSHLYNTSHTVRVPVYLQKALKHVNDAKIRLGNTKASPEEIAAEAHLGINLVEAALAAAKSTSSLDASFDTDEDGGRLKDFLVEPDDGGPYTTELEDAPLEQSIHQALDQLSDRERYVVQMRYGIGKGREHTLAEVAAELGVSLERVRQIQVRALGKLRTPGLRRVVDPFLN